MVACTKEQIGEQAAHDRRKALKKIPIGTGWKHLKTGVIYEVMDITIEEARPAHLFVSYRVWKSDAAPTWSRPIEEWTEDRYAWWVSAKNVRVGVCPECKVFIERWSDHADGCTFANG